MSDSLVFPSFRVNTDSKNRITLCGIPDNCAIVLFCSGSISIDHFSSFEDSTKVKIKMSQLIVQIYKLSRAASRTARRCDVLVLFMALCTLLISGAVQSG